MDVAANSSRRQIARCNSTTCLDAVVAGIFLVLVTAIILLSVREWILLLTRRKPAVLHETEPVWLPDYAVAEGKPLHIGGHGRLGAGAGEGMVRRIAFRTRATAGAGGLHLPSGKRAADLR